MMMSLSLLVPFLRTSEALYFFVKRMRALARRLRTSGTANARCLPVNLDSNPLNIVAPVAVCYFVSSRRPTLK
jgi:hypothetical protein